jgi:hypothetical protein
MKVQCNRCRQELKRPGALVFSPPYGPWTGLITLKFHICDECWPQVALFLQGIGTKTIVGRKPKPSKNPVIYPPTPPPRPLKPLAAKKKQKKVFKHWSDDPKNQGIA